MGLQTYREKRDFRKTAEPRGRRKSTKSGSSFVIQKHDASHLHYDFRLELDGVLKSWAVPKGPSLDPAQKRLAMEVEDHPLDYASFEGEIPADEYGGGEVIVWDNGTWHCKGDPRQGLSKGRLEFELRGRKLHGSWVLIRTRSKGERAQWLLIKRRDEAAISQSKYDVSQEVGSVLSGTILGRDQKDDRLLRKVQEGLDQKATLRKATASRKASRSEPRRGKRAPGFIEPQLAQLATEPPVGTQWIHEIKFDGYRSICRFAGPGKTIFYSRKGLDWTSKYQALVSDVEAIPARSFVLDGEIVAQDEVGKTDFLRLQSALKEGRSQDLVYFVFDLLELDGEDLRPLPLEERKARMKFLLDSRSEDPKAARILYSAHWDGVGMSLLKEGCQLGLEGIISKDVRQPYLPGRGTAWIKSKCIQGQEFVVAGYTPPAGARVGFGAVLLGAYTPEGKFRYVGKVGTGFVRKDLEGLLKKFRKLETEESPFETQVPGERKAKWILPEMVIDVQFRGWTADGLIRQGAFRGVRLDKPAREVTVDQAIRPESLPGGKSSGRGKKRTSEVKEERAGAMPEVRLTHPEKLLVPEAGVTKRDLMNYLHEVRHWMLPHVADRPLALLRCPDGSSQECFFQKNTRRGTPEALHSDSIRDEKGRNGNFLYIDSEEGLLTLAQLGAIEAHLWGSHRESPLNPDVVIFDLDPDQGIAAKKVADAALRIRDILKKLGLKSFLKVSGGKGMHVHVPIEPRYSWEQVRAFARAIAEQMVEEGPDLYLAKMTKSKRKGKIFIDYFRNSYGATSVAPYSLRARPEGGVALPVDWKDARKVKPNEFTLKRTLSLLKRRKSDPWKDYFSVRQRVSLLEEKH